MEPLSFPSDRWTSTSPLETADKRDEHAKEVREAKETDRKVRAHEQAHLAAAGASARGGMKLKTATGPDGQSYAVSGEVSVQVSGGRTPQEALENAKVAERAALAPADPSPKDLQVAQTARQAQLQARKEIREQARSQEKSGPKGYGSPTAPKGHQVDLVA